MLFLFPMWDNESQRIGKRKCTPTGYALHVIAELLGFIGGLSLLGIAIFLAYKVITDNFIASHLWLLSASFGAGIIAEILYQVSWLLATRKGFKYDYEMRVASWIDGDKRVTYNWERSNTFDRAA